MHRVGGEVSRREHTSVAAARVAAQHVDLLRGAVHRVEALGERVDRGLQPRAPHLGGLRLGEVRLVRVRVRDRVRVRARLRVRVRVRVMSEYGSIYDLGT